MNRLLASITVIVLVGLAASVVSSQSPRTADRAFSPTFRAVAVYLDCGNTPLAAYQLDISAPGSDARIVGIEGGDTPAFAEPPYHDPRAIQRDRVVIAAFSTRDDLPTGRIRVATIHYMSSGDAQPAFAARLVTAADATGERFAPAITLAHIDQEGNR